MRVKLMRGQRPIGSVTLEDERLVYHLADEQEREQIENVLTQTGEVTWAWTRIGEGEWQEHRAKPLTDNWLWFVVANILYPKGYRAEIED